MGKTYLITSEDQTLLRLMIKIVNSYKEKYKVFEEKLVNFETDIFFIIPSFIIVDALKEDSNELIIFLYPGAMI